MSAVPTAGSSSGVAVAEHDGGCRVAVSRQDGLCVVTVDGMARVDVYSAEGMLVDSKTVDGSATVRMPDGRLSIVRVVKDGRTIKTFKLN